MFRGISFVRSPYIIVLLINEFHSMSLIIGVMALFLSSRKFAIPHVFFAFSIPIATAFVRLPYMLISSPSIVPAFCVVSGQMGGGSFLFS